MIRFAAPSWLDRFVDDYCPGFGPLSVEVSIGPFPIREALSRALRDVLDELRLGVWQDERIALVLLWLGPLRFKLDRPENPGLDENGRPTGRPWPDVEVEVEPVEVKP